MYGTISRFKVKPEGWESLKRSARNGAWPQGAGAMMVFQMDADPNWVFMVAISESEAAYRAYSGSEASRLRYAEMTKWLAAEPKWHAGRVLEYQVYE